MALRRSVEAIDVAYRHSELDQIYIALIADILGVTVGEKVVKGKLPILMKGTNGNS